MFIHFILFYYYFVKMTTFLGNIEACCNLKQFWSIFSHPLIKVYKCFPSLSSFPVCNQSISYQQKLQTQQHKVQKRMKSQIKRKLDQISHFHTIIACLILLSILNKRAHPLQHVNLIFCSFRTSWQTQSK